MYIRKVNHLIVLLMAVAIIVAGCNTSSNTGQTAEPNTSDDSTKIKVITSFYPLYDFTKKIGGDHVEVVNLIPAGVDSHDWTPTFQDMASINNADILIYNGLGFEGWIESFLGSLDPSSTVAPVEASQGVQRVEWQGHGSSAMDDHGHAHEDDHAHHDDEDDEHKHEEHGHEHEDEHGVEEHEHDHEDGHGDEEHNDHHDHGAYDPHIWLSPLQAKTIASNIKNALVEKDSDNEADYITNYEVLIAQLDELHEQFTEVTSNAARKDIVVSHEAYGYLTKDYGLNQIGVMGLSPSAEPTPQTMKQITDFVRENNIKYILFEELVSSRIAETLAQEAGIETLTFNPLEGLTEEQAEAGEDYFSMMRSNLTTLEKALQ